MLIIYQRTAEILVKLLISEMKRIITLNKQCFQELFQKMDENQDGFLTVQEFYNGVDKIMKLSHEAKLGLFAYFDNQNNGMFDQNRFVSVLSRIDNNLYPTNFQDDWSWQMDIIKKWRQWFKNQNISLSEAFKLADFDFDGFLNQKDIETFLIKFLQVSEQVIDEMNIQRLYQLFDTRKRGFVQKKDLENILLGNSEFFDKKAEVKQKNNLNFHHKYWLENARKHISVYILKNFESVGQSFESISNMGDQILFRQFKKWLEEKVVLQGFNLSDQLLQTFFSYIDPHKKGYLSSVDWEKAFGQLTGKTNLALQDLKFMAYQSFDSFQDFVAFLRGQQGTGSDKGISFDSFLAGVKNLSQKIYDLKSIYDVWLQICSRVNKPQQKSTILEENDLSQLLISSGKSLQFAFEETDKSNSGKVSTIQFKQILMNLNLGLTQKEIEALVLLNSFNGDYIDYKKLLQKIKSNLGSQQLAERSEQRIIKLRKQLYDYLISPKDAFRRFDDDKSQTMSFSEFREFLIQLSSFTKEDAPPYTVAKDMYDFIDIKSDNKIDIEEWVETFARYDRVQVRAPKMPAYEIIQPEQFANKKLSGLNSRYDKPQKSYSNSTSDLKIRLLENRFDKPLYKNFADDEYKTMSYGDHFKSTAGISLKWERTAQYDSVIKLIGKNRRILQDDFVNAQAEGDKLLLHKSKVIAILDRCLRHYNIQVPPNNWEVIVRFAEEKDQKINCKFMLEVYKKRLMDHDSQPHNFKKNVFASTGSSFFNRSRNSIGGSLRK
ncbi:hypothetical protein PPERSA_01348 [Pseudocohnilembus persalinus]|uniref:EF-hand domain-containing protein n=1 Tax=Pseudocohnilembus persalinus TaxID=266149 RepID=A0A0V0QHB3_PSEPJ|nr:hypothetical protein PPERSA_01348 [Pseudocohnilembus persalinus]|eukprot:KRX01445.1 hypothetical protein PPERSA_01348 [Pseudocohnilembus persalinus]